MDSEQIRPQDLTPGQHLGLTPGTWLISDTHIGHRNIAGYCGRPSYAEEKLIDAWHRLVRPVDQIVHLGDLALGRSETLRMRLTALPGKKFLVRGNHDTQPDAFYSEIGFTLIPPFTLDVSGWTASFTHVPHSELAGSPRQLNVHGHIHEKLLPSLSCLNCSVEWTEYAPARIEELLERRIARIASAATVECTVPLSYADWLALSYGGEVLRSDVERFPDPETRDRVRETYSAYRQDYADDRGSRA